MNEIVGKLKAGEVVTFRPRGPSMRGRVESGQLCTVTPVTADTVISKGDVVYCKVKGRIFLHLVTAVRTNKTSNLYQISNNFGHVNGWTSHSQIYGKLIES